MSLLLVAALTILGCTNDPNVVQQNEDTAPDPDLTCPVIEHTPVEGAQLLNEPVPIEATIADEENAVFVAKVHFRQETSPTWDSAVLTAGADNLFIGEIPGSAVRTGGMYYFLSAMDTQENECFLPEGGESNPWHFRITSE